MTGAKRKKKSALWGKVPAPHCEDIKQWWRRRLPILEWAPQYSLKENLLPDTVSGLMLAVQQVTQGKCGIRVYSFMLNERCFASWMGIMI